MQSSTNVKRVGLVALGSLASLVILFALRTPVLEQWYLWKLDTTDETSREFAAHRLGQLKSARAIPRLVEIVEGQGFGASPDHYGLRALAAIGKPAVPSLVRILEKYMATPNPKGEIHRIVGVMEALGKIGRRAHNATTLLIEISNKCGFHPKCTNTDNFYCGRCVAYRNAAGETLPKIARVPELVEVLTNKRQSPLSRKAAVIALGNIGGEARTALPDILQALREDADEYVRARAAEALPNIDRKDEVIEAALRKTVSEDTSDYAREVGAIALAKVSRN